MDRITHLVNAVHMRYIVDMETSYPVRKALAFTAEQWEQVSTFRFEHRIATEAEAVRLLLDIGLQHGEDLPATKATGSRTP
jgi:hypothetical protein